MTWTLFFATVSSEADRLLNLTRVSVILRCGETISIGKATKLSSEGSRMRLSHASSALIMT
jgi:hypothetical protein